MSKLLAVLFKRIIYIRSWMNISSTSRFSTHTYIKWKGYDIGSKAMVFTNFTADSKANPAVVPQWLDPAFCTSLSSAHQLETLSKEMRAACLPGNCECVLKAQLKQFSVINSNWKFVIQQNGEHGKWRALYAVRSNRIESKSYRISKKVWDFRQ